MKKLGEFEHGHFNVIGTSFHGVTVTVNPKYLIAYFGTDTESDKNKISRQWTFRVGYKTFSLYDYKETSLYSHDLPTPEEYWAQDLVTLHIGHLRQDSGEALVLANLLKEVFK